MGLEDIRIIKTFKLHSIPFTTGVIIILVREWLSSREPACPYTHSLIPSHSIQCSSHSFTFDLRSCYPRYRLGNNSPGVPWELTEKSRVQRHPRPPESYLPKWCSLCCQYFREAHSFLKMMQGPLGHHRAPEGLCTWVPLLNCASLCLCPLKLCPLGFILECSKLNSILFLSLNMAFQPGDNFIVKTHTVSVS